MPKKPRADDDEDFNVCLGTGCIGELREHPARGKRVQRAIGFVHFPERPEKSAVKQPKPPKKSADADRRRHLRQR